MPTAHRCPFRQKENTRLGTESFSYATRFGRPVTLLHPKVNGPTGAAFLDSPSTLGVNMRGSKPKERHGETKAPASVCFCMLCFASLCFGHHFEKVSFCTQTRLSDRKTRTATAHQTPPIATVLSPSCRASFSASPARKMQSSVLSWSRARRHDHGRATSGHQPYQEGAKPTNPSRSF